MREQEDVRIQFTMGWLQTMWITVFLLMSVAATAVADEAVLIPIEYGSELIVDAHMERVRQDLQRRLIEVADTNRVEALWDDAIVFSPDTEVDMYFVEHSSGLTLGRNLFFDGDYERSIEELSRWLERFERSPEVLAAHPDLIPVTFECLLMMVRGYDVLDDPVAADATLERIINLFRYAEPSPYSFDEAFIARFVEARRLHSVRSLTVRWRADSDCSVLVNGSEAGIVSGGELLLPEAPQFLQLVCGDGESMIYRLRERIRGIDLDLDFDDAIHNVDGVPELWPRSSAAPDLLSRLARQAARILDVDMIFTVGLTPDTSHSPATLELSRWSVTESSFRAVRLPLDVETEDSDVSGAIQYLLTGDVTGEFVVWQELPGWVLVDENGVVIEPVEHAESVMVDATEEPEDSEIRIVIAPPSQPVAERRKFQWHFLIPLAGAGGAYYASLVFEEHRADAHELLEECGRADVECGPIVYNDREASVNNNRLYRDLSLGTAVALGVTAVGVFLGSNLNRGPRPTPTAWIDPRNGGFGASVKLMF